MHIPTSRGCLLIPGEREAGRWNLFSIFVMELCTHKSSRTSLATEMLLVRNDVYEVRKLVEAFDLNVFRERESVIPDVPSLHRRLSHPLELVAEALGEKAARWPCVPFLLSQLEKLASTEKHQGWAWGFYDTPQSCWQDWNAFTFLFWISKIPTLCFHGCPSRRAESACGGNPCAVCKISQLLTFDWIKVFLEL